MMKWTGSAIALTAVLVAAAMMPPLKAAEETPMITDPKPACERLGPIGSSNTRAKRWPEAKK